MEPEKLEKIKSTLSHASSLISEIEQKRNSKLVVFVCQCPIDHVVAYRLNKILRKLGKIENLDLLIDSGGGDIDATSKIVKLLKSHCTKFYAIVPFFAKSAATLLALGADEIVMCKSGELGLVDPQVRDPHTGLWIPAHSIKEALKFIEETEDPLVKLSMADKLPPLLMGAFRDAQNAARQYLEEALEKLGDKKEKCLETFTKKFLSHGYPIDRNLCKEEELNVTFPDEDLENKFCNLHEIYADFLIEKGKEEKGDILIIQSKSHKCVIIDGEDVSALV